MDIFSHGLWAGAGAEVLNPKIKSRRIKKLSFWQAFFWGMFPDLFAFAIPFVLVASGILLGQIYLSDLLRSEAGEPPPTDTLPVFSLANSLYNISHSLLVFIIVFFLIWFIWRRPYFEILGWLLHIIMDIPSHSYQFFPTPFLWPISSFKINGYLWATLWFLILNYAALSLVYLLIYLKKRFKRRS